jgi:hypothetical protein
MRTQPISANMILVFGRNDEIVGSISKAFGNFYARNVAQRRATKYATEEQAAAHFGFYPTPEPVVSQPYMLRAFGIVSAVVAPVAFLCACMSNQATEYGIRAATMLAGL